MRIIAFFTNVVEIMIDTMTKPKELAVPKGLSIKPSLFEEARRKAEALGLSFSQLVTILIKKDLQQNEDITLKIDNSEYDKW